MKRMIFSLVFMTISLMLLAQKEIKEDFYDAEFFFAEEDYKEALYVYNKLYNSGFQDNANINYKIGVCLLNIPGRKTESIPYLEKAVQDVTDRYREGSFKEDQAPLDAILFLGNAFRINNELDKAIEQYNKYRELLSDKDDYQLMYVDKQIESCENAGKAMANPVAISKGNLGQLIETAETKFNPVVSGDLGTLAFMGEHRFYNGVYVAKKIDGLWAKPLNITPSIQSDGNQYVLSLNQDGSKILLAWIDQFESDIFITEWANGRWNRSYPIGKPVNSKYFESHACLTPDEKSIYFTSNRNESLGGMDIFRCDRSGDGSWSEAVNLGSTINTPLNEESPFISPDGKRLYFSSQGHNTIGGYDIFYSELLPDESWSQPVNPGYPVNTTDDDFAFSPVYMQGENQLCLFAKGGEGQKDIFKFDIIPADARPVAVAFEEPAEEEQIVAAETEEEAIEAVAEEEAEEEIAAETEIVVEKPEIEEYIIKPLFFEFDSYALDAIAKEKLDNIAKLLLKFPELNIEIIGHTDAVGAYEYNQRLSLLRASSAADYLAARGIDKKRLNVTGKSESEPIAINRTKDNYDSPEGRKLNRRVQFRVIVSNLPVSIIEDIQVPEHLKIVP
ncbi:MAG: OmpA family protein [Bacteroidales bacterium]|nr:OmpA family protein [Bacteroidales bacterium]MBN2697350.1 OmpA family protein [Bacteroidales bacterium]